MLRKAVSGAAALAVCAVGVGTIPAGAILVGYETTPESFADDIKIEDEIWSRDGDYAVYGRFESPRGDMLHVSKFSDCVSFPYEAVDDSIIENLEKELREKVDENIEVAEYYKYALGTVDIRLKSAEKTRCKDGYADMTEAQAKQVFKILENYVDDAEYKTDFFTYKPVNWELDEYNAKYGDILEEYFRENGVNAELEEYDDEFGDSMLKVVPNEAFSPEDYIELAGSIAKSTGIYPNWCEPLAIEGEKTDGVSVNLADYTDGDANTDGQRTLADAVAILQSLANEDEYALTAQGIFNADIAGNDGVNINDALEIQRLATVEKFE